MEKIINKLIDEFTKGVDTYTHNGSTWLIFTESKQWVIELTDSKTLWYNYNFFKGMFAYTSMDVVENQHYITKWVEDNIINGVKETLNMSVKTHHSIEDTLENGVKSPSPYPNKLNSSEVEHIIQNGIIEKGVTENSFTFVKMKIDCENVIENGVKEIQVNVTKNKMSDFVSDSLIENGVKHTEKSLQINGSCVIEDTIQNGIKETNHVDVMKFFDNKMDDAIENGVKETQFNDNENKSWVEGVIKGGVKVTLNTEYMPTSMVEDIIQSGVKETRLEMNITEGEVDDIIQDGVKEIYEYKGFRGDVKDVIQDGVRKTLWISTEREGLVNTTINQGVKETKTPGKDGDILSTIEWMEENKSTSYTKMIDDVIDNGVKKIKTPNKDGDIQSTLEWMYKNNYQDDYNGSKMINNVIKNGIKEVRPLPEQSGELIGYGNYYKLKEDRTKPFIDYLEDTIKFGVKN